MLLQCLYLKMRGVQGEALVFDFGCAMSRLLCIGSLGFLCLSYIIGGVLWGVGMGVLGIQSVGAGMWAGQRSGTGVFILTPFN